MTDPRCGTYSRYVHGCRCDDCRAAAAAARRRLRLVGPTVKPPPTPVTSAPLPTPHGPVTVYRYGQVVAVRPAYDTREYRAVQKRATP